MKQELRFKRIEMPDPNPDNVDITYRMRMQPALVFELEGMEELYERHERTLLRQAEAAAVDFIAKHTAQKKNRRNYPLLSELTGEWYLGGVCVYMDEDNRSVYANVFLRFLGRYPKGRGPVDDYLGVIAYFRYRPVGDVFEPDGIKSVDIYQELPTNVPWDSLLCPVCKGKKLKIDPESGRLQAIRCSCCGGVGYISADGERLSFPSRLKAALTHMGQAFFILAMPFLGIFTALGLLLFALYPPVLSYLVDSAQTAAALLEGYRRWYLLLMGAGAAGVLIFLVGGALGAVGIIRTHSIPRIRNMQLAAFLGLMAVFLALDGFLAGAMLISEEVPALYQQATEDIAQIERGELEHVTVWLSPKVHQDGLPGPYTQGQPEPVKRYGGISWETDGHWVRFYIPDSLGFELDQDALYNENQSIAWNEENAQQYIVTYTTNLHVVTAVEPAG